MLDKINSALYLIKEGRKIIKNTFSKKTITIAALLLILVLNLTSNIFLVFGDAGGTGKFLEIKFTAINLADEADLLTSACEVIATKVSSGQFFTYVASNSDTYSQKVGAGTVLLEAFPAGGWVFSHFVIRGDECI